MRPGVLLLTALTLVAFASNSLLCRLALGGDRIDPLSFTALRLGSGALGLALAVAVARRQQPSKGPGSGGSWGSGVALFAYAIAFSLAYVTLPAGVGALILFACVQATMIGAALRAGARLGAVQWLGVATALGGLAYLVSPGLAAPDPSGVALMALAGIAWGVYSLRGRGAVAPLHMTAGNFVRAVPLGLAPAVVFALAAAAGARAGGGAPISPALYARPDGMALAVVSGMIASAPAYVLWYGVLRHVDTTQASVVQLLVPVIAAAAGVLLLGEPVTVRLVAGSALILGGVAMAARGRRR